MPKIDGIKKVLVIGSGPIVIGQAAEFDYAGTQACRLRRLNSVYTHDKFPPWSCSLILYIGAKKENLILLFAKDNCKIEGKG